MHPTKYGKNLDEMGWIEHRGYFEIPKEKGAVLRVEIEGTLLYLKLIFRNTKPNYHLEKISYRGVAPRFWSNWAMLYIDLNDLEDLTTKLSNVVSLPNQFCKDPAHIKHEIQQGGQEDTYFTYEEGKALGVKAESFSLCLGCFDHVPEYFKNESLRYGANPVTSLKLRLESRSIPSMVKIGPAKMVNKHPQFMVKLVAHSDYKKRIRKLDGEEIEGKAKGEVVYCDHKDKENWIAIDAEHFLRACCCAKQFLKRTPYCDEVRAKCYSSRLRKPSWF